MIHANTVLVLGAGASIPYGFPSGRQLTEQLWRGAETAESPVCVALERCDIERIETQRVLQTFQRSRIASIDAFLSRQPDFSAIGKFCIAYLLGSREIGANLHAVKPDEDWYLYLWNRLAEGAHTLQELADNRLRVLTFNYDRSLEHYLQGAAMATYGAAPGAAAEALSRLSLMHVYGSLGEYNWGGNLRGRAYSPVEARADALRAAATHIRVIPEAREDDEGFREARRWFDWADRICFLGFGFDELNVKRLGLGPVYDERVARARARPIVYASRYGLTDAEIGHAKERLCPSCTDWRAADATNLRALREMGALL